MGFLRFTDGAATNRHRDNDMDASPGTHARFDSPPVIETFLGIEFKQLSKWQIPFFGLYWETIRDRYPKFSVHPALVSQLEDLSEEPVPSKPLSLSLSPLPPPVRCWFFNELDTQLIQVQRDRFVFNWKRGLADEPYPHYVNIRPVVSREWAGFCDFLTTNSFGDCVVTQCEITYINHIEIGLGWKDYGELNGVFTFWSGATREGFLSKPEDVEINIRYRIPNRLGRLYVRAQPAIRNTDHKEIIQLTLAVRGAPPTPDPTKVFDWFDYAQDWVAKGFADLTTDKMHSLWGKRTKP